MSSWSTPPKALADLNRRFTDPVFTLAVVTRHDNEATPSNDPIMVAMRDRFHEELLMVGIGGSVTGHAIFAWDRALA